MSDPRVRLHFILEKIEDLNRYRDRFGSVVKLLEDPMGFDAALMCL